MRVRNGVIGNALAGGGWVRHLLDGGREKRELLKAGQGTGENTYRNGRVPFPVSAGLRVTRNRVGLGPVLWPKISSFSFELFLSH